MVEKIYTFCLPDIGEGVVEGEVVEWLKNPGDAVAQDEPVVVVMTDKATVELPSPYPGTVIKQYYRPGEKAIKDLPLYDIRLDPSSTAILPEAKVSKPEQPKKSKKKAAQAPVAKPRCEGVSGGAAIPKVRHLAKEMGIDLSNIAGSGKEGRITEEDLKNSFNRERKVVPHFTLEGDESHQLLGVRGLMARRMDERNVPQFSYFEQAIVTRLIQLRHNVRESAIKEGIQLTYMPFFIRALSMTAKRFPFINASVSMKEGAVVAHKVQNIGIAMASQHGLIVPVLKGVEKMSLNEIIRGYEQLKVKAAEGKLLPADMKEATITISNFGVLGGDGMWATPMINEPETAIIAVARIRKAPVFKGGEIVPLDVLPVSWSFDHRVIDGELAALISHYFTTLLKDPAFLL